MPNFTNAHRIKINCRPIRVNTCSVCTLDKLVCSEFKYIICDRRHKQMTFSGKNDSRIRVKKYDPVYYLSEICIKCTEVH